MIRISSCALVGALAASLAAGYAAPASAQTFEACRVPAVGVIYMINVGDAPTACLDASHIPFSWTEGGAPGPNSVTSGMIVDGTIAATDLAAGLVPGVEFGSSFANIDPTTTSSTAASISLSYPASGYIVASGVGQIQCTAVQTTSLGISNGGTTHDGWSNSAPETGAGVYAMMPKQEVIAVTGAGTATLNFNIQLFTTDNCSYFRVVNFHAIYVPARY